MKDTGLATVIGVVLVILLFVILGRATGAGDCPRGSYRDHPSGQYACE